MTSALKRMAGQLDGGVLPCSETSAQTLEPQRTVFHSWPLSVSGIHLVLVTALCYGKGRSRFPQLAGDETGSQLARGTHTRRQLLARRPLLIGAFFVLFLQWQEDSGWGGSRVQIPAVPLTDLCDLGQVAYSVRTCSSSFMNWDGSANLVSSCLQPTRNPSGLSSLLKTITSPHPNHPPRPQFFSHACYFKNSHFSGPLA